MGFHQGQHMYNNANNPLWTWWQPYWCWSLEFVDPIRYIKKHQDTLPIWHQGQREDQDILQISTCWDLLYCPCSPWAHVESKEIFFKRITWVYNSTMWVWTSYQQWLIHTSITQPSGDTPNVHTCLNIAIITSSFPCIIGVQITSCV